MLVIGDMLVLLGVAANNEELVSVVTGRHAIIVPQLSNESGPPSWTKASAASISSFFFCFRVAASYLLSCCSARRGVILLDPANIDGAYDGECGSSFFSPNN